MKKFSVIMLALVFAVALSSCGGGGDDPKDTEAPAITINSPSAGAIITCGDPVSVDVSITDNKALAGWAYGIVLTTPAKKNTADWEVVITDTPEVLSGVSATKTKSETVPADAKLGTYTLTVTATDATGNVRTATRTFTVVAQ